MAYTMEDLLSVLHPHGPVKVDALSKNRRRVETRLTTVGLKIHCLGDNRDLSHLIDALGGRSEVIANRFYAHARASVSVILPPVGSARSAILLLGGARSISGTPSSIIQSTDPVCSPCRLDGPHPAILAIAFYLGSDVLRRYSLDDLATTFSEDTLRMVSSIEDAVLSSMTARVTSTGTSNGGALTRIACRYCRDCRS